MARERFLISDTHFSEPGMCAFTGRDGVSPLRPWGRAMPDWKQMSAEEKADLLPEFVLRAEEMDEALVDRWNAMVPATGATVYHLGDVTKNKRDLPILDRLAGKKKLIFGNHDILGYKVYAPYFYDMASYRIGDGIVMSHIPISPESLTRKAMATNVHGHTHADRVMIEIDPHQNGLDGTQTLAPDPRYLCVSVEQIEYTPLPWDDMMARIAKQQEARDG